MASIQSALESIKSLAAAKFLEAYISNVGYGQSVICIAPDKDVLNPILVLGYNNGLRIIKHRTEELTKNHRDKKISLDWVKKFIEINGGEQHKNTSEKSSHIQPDIPEMENWRDWHH
ncbi:hypothetical protein N5J23_14680 [Comamonas aquatica]|uniref:Uncharacterized protein n=1 Tax=Comamonas aquatica TaxID=225991 RepID=A0AA43AXR1_9BURK|nr:hypothetical protein [Comamonas aquatica]MDH1430158.1 hypothetical protein [Comamonas aquatica]MDH1607038.1 hypothetical protein [Comamonas aquatica]MDH1618775.1 hypothetical protein [Comamonas aquatica]MDH2006775.1 hypothetical protein [Comamonas aquatica]